jgi:nitronate monooxygenase
MAATCDDTVRTTVYDIVRATEWPAIYNGRQLRNDFLSRWHDREPELRAHLAEARHAFTHAKETGDYSIGNIIVGEAIGLIKDVLPARTVIVGMIREAAAVLLTTTAPPTRSVPENMTHHCGNGHTRSGDDELTLTRGSGVGHAADSDRPRC